MPAAPRHHRRGHRLGQNGGQRPLHRRPAGAAEPWAVFIVDCKGGELRETAQELASAHGVRFQEVNPGQPDSLRYDITQLGSPAEIADKLTAAFPTTPEAGIYRDTSYHALVHAAAAPCQSMAR